MIGFIIWIIGVVLCVKAVLEIMKWPVDGVKKLLVAIIILLTSLIGICVYYSTFRKEAQPRFPDIFLPQLPRSCPCDPFTPRALRPCRRQIFPGRYDNPRLFCSLASCRC